jgi:putative transposase
MSFRIFGRSMPHRFRLVLDSFLQDDGLPFADVMSEQEIQEAFDAEGVAFAQGEKDVYTPQITLWAFLSQAVFKAEHRSCAAAVARVGVLMATLGRCVSGDTAAYCRARTKLPEPVIRCLTTTIAQRCEDTCPDEWLWNGRHAYLVDGTTLSMPDTKENQAQWPQPSSQKPGLGFPMIRMLVVMSLATGMLVDMAMGPYAGKETGEPALLRQLLDTLEKGCIVVADRYFSSYFMLAMAIERELDAVVRQHQLRKTDFLRGRILNRRDHVVCWERPQKPKWMDQETYDRMPLTLEVREIEVDVEVPGFRATSFVVATTLIDATAYTTSDIASLYHDRWQVELDIRALKISMGLDVLRCKSPEMVRKEIWVGLLAYNRYAERCCKPRGTQGDCPVS